MKKLTALLLIGLSAFGGTNQVAIIKTKTTPSGTPVFMLERWEILEDGKSTRLSNIMIPVAGTNLVKPCTNIQLPFITHRCFLPTVTSGKNTNSLRR